MKKSEIVIGGTVYATPEKFRQRGTALWGYFLADDTQQYDQWMYWGESTPENLEAIRAAGITVEMSEEVP